MREVTLTRGKFALVDDADYALVAQHKWYALKVKNCYYAARSVWNPRRIILMHRVIMGLQPCDEEVTDHRNRNGLDNQRCNLKVCTQQENLRNRGAKGAYKKGNRWVSQITIDGACKYIGCFGTEVEACTAFQKQKQELFGD